jgi:hypothetical protein
MRNLPPGYASALPAFEPMSKGTTRRAVRIEDGVWAAAKAAAAERGDNLSAVIRLALVLYIKESRAGE